VYPRIVNAHHKGVRVQFLDINLITLSLIMDAKAKRLRTEDEYYNKLEKNAYPYLPSFHEASSYVEYLWRAMRMLDKNAHWRVLRSHHPPFNLRGDKDGIMLWTVKVDGMTFFDLLKQHNVKVWIASHDHAGMLLAFPLEKVDLLKEHFKPPKKNKKKRECIYLDPDDIEEKEADLETKCTDDTLNYNFQDDFSNGNKGYLWTFVVGNSGRELENIDSNQTRAAFVYGYSAFGGCNFTFKKKGLRAQFFKNDEGDLEVLSNVELTHKVHKHYKVFNNQIKKKIKVSDDDRKHYFKNKFKK